MTLCKVLTFLKFPFDVFKRACSQLARKQFDLSTQDGGLAAINLMLAWGAKSSAFWISPEYLGSREDGQPGWLNSLWREVSTLVSNREPHGS